MPFGLGSITDKVTRVTPYRNGAQEVLIAVTCEHGLPLGGRLAVIRQLGHDGGGFGFGCSLSYYPQAQLARAAFFNRYADIGTQFGAAAVAGLLTRRYGARKLADLQGMLHALEHSLSETRRRGGKKAEFDDRR